MISTAFEEVAYEPRLVCTECFCLSNAVWGSGATSRNGGGHDGWNLDDPLPPTAGRGPLIQSFRNHMMRVAKVTPKKSFQNLKIYVARFSSQRMPLGMPDQIDAINASLPQLTSLLREVSGSTTAEVTLEDGILYRQRAAEQIQKMSETAIFVGVAGGGAMSAQFLPDGASLILYYARQDHEGKDDWKIFNMYSPIRTTYLLVSFDRDMSDFMKLIRQELVSCAMFMKFD